MKGKKALQFLLSEDSLAELQINKPIRFVAPFWTRILFLINGEFFIKLK